MKTKIALFASTLVFAGAVRLLIQPNDTRQSDSPTRAANRAVGTSTIAGDKQIVEISVKDGYQPQEIMAKAGMPLVLKMKSQGTFDCSTAFSIQKVGIQTRLQPTGEATFEIVAQKAGESLHGVCTMGMQTFVIKFL